MTTSMRLRRALTGLAVVAAAAGGLAVAAASPALADGGCQWGGQSFQNGATVVVNGFQFDCHDGSGSTFWDFQGHTSAADTPGLNGEYNPGDPVDGFSDGAGLLGPGDEMFTAGAGSWNDAGSYDDWYNSSGDTGGGDGGGVAGLDD